MVNKHILNFIRPYNFISATLFLAIVLMGCEQPTFTDRFNDFLPPAVPERIGFTYNADGEIELRWTENNEPDFKFYIIQKSIGDSTNFATIANTRSTYFFDDSLDYATTYFYRVFAVDNWGDTSKPTAIASATPKNLYRPARPYDVNVFAFNNADGTGTQISWRYFQESDIKHFQIHRSLNPGFIPDSSSLIARTTFSPFRDTSLEALINKDIYYKLVTEDKGGLLSNPTFESGDRVLPTPTFVTPIENGNLAIGDYVIFRCDSSYGTANIILQSSIAGGEVWRSGSIQLDGRSSNYLIPFSAILPLNAHYYLGVVTYTKTLPNSFSKFVKIMVTN